MKAILVTLGLFCLAPLAMAAPTFTAYVGKNAKMEGDGAERTVIDDMEIWTNGSPPRKFEILGYLTDRRHKTGLYGAIRMSSLEKEVVKAAREHGGDAVILVGAEAELVGVHSFGSFSGNGSTFGTNVGNSFSGTTHVSGYGSSISAPIEKENSRYCVIRYIDDGTTAESTAPSVAPASRQRQSGHQHRSREQLGLIPKNGPLNRFDRWLDQEVRIS